MPSKLYLISIRFIMNIPLLKRKLQLIFIKI
jgi:hypothetical protein